MQPRFAALLFVLGLADLAYVNLGLGHEVFGNGASGGTPPGNDKPAPSPAPGMLQAARATLPPPAPTPPESGEAAPTEPPPSAPPGAAPSAEAPPPTSPSASTEAPSPVPAAAPAPTPEALALPAPAAPLEPQREAAPPAAAPPPERLDDTPRTEPAPAGADRPSAPRPAQAGLGAAIARADVAVTPNAAQPKTAAAPSTVAAAEAPAPIASAASLPDAEVTVAFPDTASAWLTEPAYAQLMALAAKLRAHPDYRVHIVGHADARGSREFNLDLGGRRARVVTELLARAGVPRRQLETESRGEDEPREVGDSEQVWAANRRVEISVGTERSTPP